jgi:hypothetical protein
MVKDTAMADGRYKYSTGGLVLKILFIPWSRILLEKLTGSQLVKKFPAFMETEGSLPHSQVPANCPYHEPDQSNPYLHIPRLENLPFQTLKFTWTILVCHFCPFHFIRQYTLASTEKLNC